MFGLAKITKKQSILITIILFLLLIGSIVLYVLKCNEQWLMIIIMILSVCSMVSLNGMITKLVVFKPKKIKYPKCYYKALNYTALEAKLNKNGFKMTSKNYGAGFIKIEDKTAYKVILIENDERYFNQEDKTKDKHTKGIEKCTEFIGFEFFLNPIESTLERLPDFSFTGDNIFYTGFYLDKGNNNLVECNKIDPKEHLDSYLKLKEYLSLEEINEDTNILADEKIIEIF